MFDAVKAVCDSTGCTGALVMEDTILLRPDVTYEEVAAEVRQRNAPAGASATATGGRKRTTQDTWSVAGGASRAFG